MRLCPAIAVVAGLFLSGSVSAVDVQPAEFSGRIVWSEKAEWFGGFSALEVNDDGTEFLALSDRSTLVIGRLVRSEGRIARIETKSVHKVRSSKNKALKGRAGDSEGLAVSDTGKIYISFEGVHRVAGYAHPDDRAGTLPRPDAFRRLAQNGSFETLAMDQRGWIYTMPESSRLPNGQIPVYRWNGRSWSMPFTLDQHDRFLPVGADFGPDGKLYLLERATGFFGFRSRIRQLDLSHDQVIGEQVLLTTSSGRHDNLEGLSVWLDGDGRLRATMISDDNFLPIQQTELIEYFLPD